MKILIYDWIQDNHPGNQGGGVQYYQKNLIEELKERNEISSIAILSSGRTYDWRYPEIRIINLPSDDLKIRRYDLVNSGVPAPASNFFSNLYALSHQRTFQAFEKFLCKYGPFDVVHFNHFEGLPAHNNRAWKKLFSSQERIS